eukprot:9486203-Pyramimonas_sp.AAC.1
MLDVAPLRHHDAFVPALGDLRAAELRSVEIHIQGSCVCLSRPHRAHIPPLPPPSSSMPLLHQRRHLPHLESTHPSSGHFFLILPVPHPRQRHHRPPSAERFTPPTHTCIACAASPNVQPRASAIAQ